MFKMSSNTCKASSDRFSSTKATPLLFIKEGLFGVSFNAFSNSFKASSAFYKLSKATALLLRAFSESGFNLKA